MKDIETACTQEFGMPGTQPLSLKKNLVPFRFGMPKDIRRKVGKHRLDGKFPLLRGNFLPEHPKAQRVAELKPMQSRERQRPSISF